VDMLNDCRTSYCVWSEQTELALKGT